MRACCSSCRHGWGRASRKRTGVNYACTGRYSWLGCFPGRMQLEECS
jgi:hypothetical protein